MSNLACYDNYIGVRGEQGAAAPRSGLYIEDVPGVDVKRMANIASDSTGVGLIKKCIREACDQVTEEALNYRNGKAQPIQVGINYTGATYTQSKYTDNLLQAYNGERGLLVELRRPDFYQFSSLVVKRIYLKAGQDVSGVIVKIKEGDKVTSLDPVDLLKDEVLTIDEINYKSGNRKIEIVTDQTGIRFYQAYTPAYSGCQSCGGNRNRYIQDTISQLYVDGGFGVSADVALECDLDRIKCGILPYLRYAVRYKAVMLLALEGKFTDRLNFYAASMDFDEFYGYMDEKYEEAIERQIPSLRHLLKPLDHNCFKCYGTARGSLTY